MSSQPPPSSLLARLPALLTGPGFMAVGAYVFIKVGPPVGSGPFKIACVLAAFGVLWSALALFLPKGRWASLLSLASMNLLVLCALLAAIEVTGRVAKINFGALGNKSALAARHAYPLWAREPDKPFSDVYFQHPGPVSWTGQPIRTVEVLRKGTDNAYVNEPKITVDYDKDGFRNPPDLKDWDAAVVGDSYTELGYLPFDQISSSIAAQRSGLRVKNLGVCDTGLLTYATYLHHFGVAQSCKRVVFVMFEGNDVQDTTKEFVALRHFQQTGERDCKEIAPQISFIRAMMELVRNRSNAPSSQSYQNAWFKSGGKEVPITISVELPIDPAKMASDEILAVKAGITSMASEARALHLEASLVYVPLNNRVYHGMLRFDDKLPEEIRNWKPHDLPSWVATICKQEGMAFHDATPPMRAAAEKGVYVHNQILDCHVNAEGARIIGEVIAEALKSSH